MPLNNAPLRQLLDQLSAQARRLGWSDAEWARRSGVPKETLCRLRSRRNCDLATLASLAASVGTQLQVRSAQRSTTKDGRFPVGLDRAYEQQLLDLIRSGSTQAEDWQKAGPGFFMAGLAVTLASAPEYNRKAYLALAETLHPGMTEPRVFEQWLKGTTWPPSRFVAALRGGPARAA